MIGWFNCDSSDRCKPVTHDTSYNHTFSVSECWYHLAVRICCLQCRSKDFKIFIIQDMQVQLRTHIYMFIILTVRLCFLPMAHWNTVRYLVSTLHSMLNVYYYCYLLYKVLSKPRMSGASLYIFSWLICNLRAVCV